MFKLRCLHFLWYCALLFFHLLATLPQPLCSLFCLSLRFFSLSFFLSRRLAIRISQLFFLSPTDMSKCVPHSSVSIFYLATMRVGKTSEATAIWTHKPPYREIDTNGEDCAVCAVNFLLIFFSCSVLILMMMVVSSQSSSTHRRQPFSMLSTGNFFFLSDNSMKHTHNENVFSRRWKWWTKRNVMIN